MNYQSLGFSETERGMAQNTITACYTNIHPTHSCIHTTLYTECRHVLAIHFLNMFSNRLFVAALLCTRKPETLH